MTGTASDSKANLLTQNCMDYTFDQFIAVRHHFGIIKMQK
jgi:hypothetical protein